MSYFVTYWALVRGVCGWQSAAVTSKHARILVVDDDPELRSLLQRFLEEHGLHVRSVAGGSAMDQALRRDPADLIVLDLMMPDEDGLAILRRLRDAGERLPVIMLTARGDPVDRVLGLELGADDYVAKPFHPRELVARINVQLRRVNGEPAMLKDEALVAGPLEINLSAMSVRRDGRPVALSSREFALLAALARSPGHVLTRSQLIDRALGRDAEVTDRAIDVQVARLRRALGDDATNPRIIRTVWGVGYVLVAVSDD